MKFGILPTKNVTNGTRDITNRETESVLSNKIYKVDTSKLTFKYKVGDETRILSDSASPELMDKLKEAVWKHVSNSSVCSYITGTHQLGEKDADLIVDLQDFITKNFNKDTLTGSALRDITDLTVEFSGEYGYMSEPPTYPLSDNVLVSKISDDAVEYMYDIATTTNGAYVSCNINDNIKTLAAGGTVSVTSLQQTYVDDNDKSQTDYIFKVNNQEIKGKDGNSIPSSLYTEITRLLTSIATPNKDTVNTYITQEAKKTETIEKGSFKITLLGMTDATGASVDISSLVNSGTTSWDVFYNTSNGEFKYVGQEGNKSFSVNLSMLGDNFDNIDIDMSGTTNGNNGNKSSVTGKKLDGRKIGTRSGVSIGTDGIVTALYSNGMSRKLGQICVATFPNAMGLENSGDNLYQVTAGSGDASIVDIKASGTGVMTSGVLEMSNVDLSQQFTDMITTQRGFQANSRIITTSDTLLEELVNLKR